MTSEPIPIPQIIQESKDWLVHFHANDPNGLVPGMGRVDYQPILQALKDIQYDGWTSVETFERTRSAEQIARQSIDYLTTKDSLWHAD